MKIHVKDNPGLVFDYPIDDWERHLNAPNFSGIQAIDDYAIAQIYKCNNNSGGIYDAGLLFNDLKRVGKFGMYQAFYRNTQLKYISFPQLRFIDVSGLREICAGGTTLESINFQFLETVQNQGMESAFLSSGVSDDTELVFPKLSYVGEYGFANAFKSTNELVCNFPKVSFPLLKTLTCGTEKNSGYNFGAAFYHQSLLEEIDFPELESCCQYAFANAFEKTAVTIVTFPKIKTLAKHALFAAFKGCSDLTDIYLPALETKESELTEGWWWGEIVRDCTNFVAIHLPSALRGEYPQLEANLVVMTGNPSSQVLYDL